MSRTPTKEPSRILDSSKDQLSLSPAGLGVGSYKHEPAQLPALPSPALKPMASVESVDSGTIAERIRTNESTKSSRGSHSHHGRSFSHANEILGQVSEWLRQEKARRASHKSRRPGAHSISRHTHEALNGIMDHIGHAYSGHRSGREQRRSSDVSEASFALDKLESILSKSLEFEQANNKVEGDDKATNLRRRRSSKKSKQMARRASTVNSSDTEHPDNELLVPSAEVWLDNSKTFGYSGYSGGIGSSEIDLSNLSALAAKEKENWRQFKAEIVTLSHTLKIPGWRRVPIEQGGEIDVERLCSALSNAVYIVSPPKNLPANPAGTQGSTTSLTPRRPPPRLLLRVYGAQSDHLIDRESELQVLRRLARKSIGPRLLGTFLNGRFEQFLYAKTLTAQDLRVPETSKQIAKRMRELHDGIDLLKEERESGPFIWTKWDKWVKRCDEVMKILDRMTARHKATSDVPNVSTPIQHGYVCGVEWKIFRGTVYKYREWLYAQYGGVKSVSKNLVFAHNDAQYGNLLRLEPSGQSPLLLPANEHKQLVVIDFEYSGANLRGLEFANHFTEWCYNYHHPTKSWTLNHKVYPTLAEQTRFLKAYVQHRPTTQTVPSTPTLSPVLSYQSVRSPTTPGAAGGPGGGAGGGSISSFKLDSSTPYAEEERQRDEATDEEVRKLQHETRIWRAANSAQWVAWGIVQAKEGMAKAEEEKEAGAEAESTNIPSTEGTDSVTTTSTNTSSSHHHAHEHQKLASDPLQPSLEPYAAAARDKRPELSRGEESVPKEEGNNSRNEGAHTQDEEQKTQDGDDDGDDDDDETEFDNLAYARDRALFFWGDMLQLGLVHREELPEDLLRAVKVVEY